MRRLYAVDGGTDVKGQTVRVGGAEISIEAWYAVIALGALTGLWLLGWSLGSSGRGRS